MLNCKHKLNEILYLSHSNGFIYKGKVKSICKEHFKVQLLDGYRTLKFNFKDSCLDNKINDSFFIFNGDEYEVKCTNEKMKRYYEPKQFKYINNELFFNGEKISDLNNVQKGTLIDYIDNLPSSDDVSKLEECEEAIYKVASIYNELSYKSEEELREWATEVEDEETSIHEAILKQLKSILDWHDILE